MSALRLKIQGRDGGTVNGDDESLSIRPLISELCKRRIPAPGICPPTPGAPLSRLSPGEEHGCVRCARPVGGAR
ncbi:hypothetical protein C6035_24590 [Salmonella enterica]|nr:hypothetical protein [Salmonella enterica]EDW0585282.1 hypothetical protein [Salmonella enterica subsp. enterica serovar Poona]EAW3604946.1 hypothetical protein [Salmonella enterica]EBC7007011.1 hypothetical protein [Salmonella enterica]EBG7335517.1 hypothetical protein [Salmonella enterica]